VRKTALDAETTEHLGFDKHHRVGRVSGSNYPNGTRPKTALTEIGPVEIEGAGDDSLRQRLEIPNRRNRELSDENRRRRPQPACAPWPTPCRHRATPGVRPDTPRVMPRKTGSQWTSWAEN